MSLIEETKHISSMKVKDLIELLKSLPQDKEIFIDDGDSGVYPIHQIEPTDENETSLSILPDFDQTRYFY